MRLNRRLLAVTRKEVKEIVRDKLYLVLAFGVPLILYILFGFGLTLDAKNIPFAVIDQNRSPLSRTLVDRLVNSTYFTLQDYLTDPQQLTAGLVNGRLRLGLIIPPNFDRTLYSGRPSEVQALIDGAFPDKAAAILSYLDIITREFNRDLRLNFSGSRPDELYIHVETRAWYNPDLESKNFIVPGLIATNLFFYTALLASIAVVRERESGSIFNIYCSPIRPWEYVLGKLLPYWTIGFLNFFVLAGLARVHVCHSLARQFFLPDPGRLPLYRRLHLSGPAHLHPPEDSGGGHASYHRYHPDSFVYLLGFFYFSAQHGSGNPGHGPPAAGNVFHGNNSRGVFERAGFDRLLAEPVNSLGFFRRLFRPQPGPAAETAEWLGARGQWSVVQGFISIAT